MIGSLPTPRPPAKLEAALSFDENGATVTVSARLYKLEEVGKLIERLAKIREAMKP